MEPDQVLRGSGLIAGLDESEVMDICDRLKPLNLRAGEVLFEQGEEGDAVYLVRRGRLRVERQSEAMRFILGEVGPGAYVGEMALVSGEPRSATVRAARDTALLRMDRATLEAIVQRNPRCGLMLARTVIERAAQTSATPTPGDWSFALVCAADDPALQGAVEDWLATLKRRTGAIVIDRISADRPPDLDHLEVLAEHLVFDLRAMDDPAARRWALRQSDRCVVFECDPHARQASLEQEIVELTRPNVPTDHILLDAPAPSETWPIFGEGGRTYQRYRHDGTQASMDRIVRNQTACAVGLAMSGGAVRGVAHLGVYQAWQESGFVVDRLAGTSAGGIASAAISTGAPAEQLVEPLERVLRSSLLADMNPPFVSLLSGRQMARTLAELIPDIRIEDALIPVHLVCSDLVTASKLEPRFGPLRLLARATSSLPGVWPPVPFGDSLLVDGGLFDNLPAAILCPWTSDGFIAAVDVSDPFSRPTVAGNAHTVSGWALLRERIVSRVLAAFGVRRPLALPNLGALDTVVRASTLGSEPAYLQSLNELADCTIRPPISANALTSIRQKGVVAEIVRTSRDAAMRQFDELTDAQRSLLEGASTSRFAQSA